MMLKLYPVKLHGCEYQEGGNHCHLEGILFQQSYGKTKVSLGQHE